jgi:hypothetical protein
MDPSLFPSVVQPSIIPATAKYPNLQIVPPTLNAPVGTLYDPQLEEVSQFETGLARLNQQADEFYATALSVYDQNLVQYQANGVKPPPPPDPPIHRIPVVIWANQSGIVHGPIWENKAGTVSRQPGDYVWHYEVDE